MGKKGQPNKILKAEKPLANDFKYQFNLSCEIAALPPFIFHHEDTKSTKENEFSRALFGCGPADLCARFIIIFYCFYLNDVAFILLLSLDSGTEWVLSAVALNKEFLLFALLNCLAGKVFDWPTANPDTSISHVIQALV